MRRRTAAVLAALALAVPIATYGGPVAHASPTDLPDTSACGQLELAPILDSDKADDGSAIAQKPDRRGVFVPIIMVPDWTGMAKHDDSRTGDFSAPVDMSASGPPPAVARASLIGLLQAIPGAAVYTFDYRRAAGRWVDDPGIGPALGDGIDCVSAALGQKAVLITHGLGGVAARYAVAGNVPGHDRGAKVSTVIGFGSPQLGSQLADLLYTGVGTTASEPRTMLRLLLGACSALAPARFDSHAPCGTLTGESTALGLGGGDSYRGTSNQQMGLLPYPTGVTLDSFAGDITVKSSGLGWFGLRPFRTDSISLGDLTASTASATAGAAVQLRSPCAFTLDAFGKAAQSVGLHLTDAALPDLASQWAGTPRPCFSPDLPRVADFADSISAIIVKEIRNRQPMSTTELESLQVPALCGHPTGKLVGGLLPGIPDGEGQVGLASTLDPSRFKDYTVFGDINGDTVPDTIVVLKCTDASGSGSDTVAAYDSQGNPLGVIGLDQITKQPRNEVYKVKINKEQGEIDWRTTRPTDDACCPTVDAVATFTWDATSAGLKAGQLTSFNEVGPAGSLMVYAEKGDTSKKLPVATAPEILNAMIAANRDTAAFETLSCYGPAPADTSWPQAALAEYGRAWPPGDGAPHGDRFCLIKLGSQGAGTGPPASSGQPNGAPEDERYALLGMEHTGFKTWRAVEFRMPQDRPVLPPVNPGGNPAGPGGLLGPLTP